MEETQHFAWLSTPAAYNPETHSVFDEPWRRLTIQGAEGQSAVAEVEVKHPGTGLLAAGRELYAHISLTRDSMPHHLFSGRVIGAPNGLAGDFITVTFDARFGDLAAAIDAVVAPLKVSPGWDPLFVDPARLDQPMEVLDAYHAHLHVDPRNQAVRVSDALVGSAVSTSAVTPDEGEITITVPAGLAFAHGVRVRVWYRKDFREHFSGPITAYSGTSMTVDADDFNGVTERADWVISLDIRAADIVADSEAMTVSHQPYAAVRTFLEAQWVQTAAGDVDLTNKIKDASGGPNIRTLNLPDDFAETWPRSGDAVNGQSGYTVKASSLEPQSSPTTVLVLAPGIAMFNAFSVFTYRPTLVVSYEVEQKRVETATMTLEGNTQPLIGDLTQVEPLEFRLQDVGPVLPSAAHASFFLTDRGRQAIAHGLQRARVALAESQRCIEVGARCEGWPLWAVYMTCDHTACVHSPKFPGGIAIGKVAQYSKTMGENGRSCEFTLKCSIGKGYTVTAGSTDSDYVEDGYVEEGYIGGGVSGVWQTGGANPISVATYSDQQPADAFHNLAHWSENDFVQSITVGPQYEAQHAYLVAHQPFGPQAYQDGTLPHTPEKTLQKDEVRTALVMELASLASEDELRHDIEITPVGAYGLVPTVDMEAA